MTEKNIKHRRLPNNIWIDMPQYMDLRLESMASGEYSMGYVEHPLPEGVVVQKDPDARYVSLPANVRVTWLDRRQPDALAVLDADEPPAELVPASALSPLAPSVNTIASDTRAVVAEEVRRLRELVRQRPLSPQETAKLSKLIGSLSKLVEAEVAMGGYEQVTTEDEEALWERVQALMGRMRR